MKQIQSLLRRSLSYKILYTCSTPQTPQKPQINSTVDQYTASYSIADNIPGTKEGNSGVYVLMFTCGKCEHKMARTFTKDAYHKGVVLIRCDGCDNIHLIADNLGWFEDDKWNIEIHQQQQGQPLPKVNDPQVSELIKQFIQNQTNRS